jgi:hypothetical protein
MRKILKKEEYEYMDCSINLSTKKMADVLYAAIMTQSAITNSYGVGIYEYDRSQNSRNGCDLKIHIHPTMIDNFQELSGIKLRQPIQVQLNSK